MRAAAFQMLLSDDMDANRAKISDALAELAGNCDVLVTPECALTGYLPPPDFDQERVEQHLDQLRHECRSHKVALALGTAWREDDKTYNRALLINRAGRIVGRYDKTCLIGLHDGGMDAGIFAPGNTLDVFRLHKTCVGLQVCFDMRFQENWQILAAQGARVVFHLSSAAGDAAWKAPVLAGCIATRAAESGVFIVAANNALAPQMMASTINNPNGEVLAHAAPDREEIIQATLDLSHDADWFHATLPPSRRPDLWNKPPYKDLLR